MTLLHPYIPYCSQGSLWPSPQQLMQHPWDPGLSVPQQPSACLQKMLPPGSGFPFCSPSPSQALQPEAGRSPPGWVLRGLVCPAVGWELGDRSWDCAAGHCPALFCSSSHRGRLSAPRRFSLSPKHTCYCLTLSSFPPSRKAFPPQQLVSQPPSLSPDTTDDVLFFITVTVLWLTGSFTCQYSLVSTD